MSLRCTYIPFFFRFWHKIWQRFPSVHSFSSKMFHKTVLLIDYYLETGHFACFSENCINIFRLNLVRKALLYLRRIFLFVCFKKGFVKFNTYNTYLQSFQHKILSNDLFLIKTSYFWSKAISTVFFRQFILRNTFSHIL